MNNHHMNMKRIPSYLTASFKGKGEIVAFVGKVGLTASADAASMPRFQMDLYNGGPMNFYWSDIPVIVDLQGMRYKQTSPVFRDHKASQIVGHTEKVWIDAFSLKVEGVISGSNAYSQEVIDSSNKKFPWQASMGAAIYRVEEVKAGISKVVNGKDFKGPFLIVTESELKEASFVPLGADDSTIARMIAASLNLSIPPVKKDDTMDPELKAFLLASGFTEEEIAALSPESEQLKSLKAAHELIKPKKKSPPAKINAGGDVDLANVRTQYRNEIDRLDKITKICAGHQDIMKKAIDENWDSDKAELEVLRASRSTGSNGSSGIRTTSAKVLEACVLRACMDENLEKHVDEKTLEAAEKLHNDVGGMNLSVLFITAARMNGYSGHSIKVNNEILKAAYGLSASGMSTVDISGILSNIANKFLLNGFMSVEQSWGALADIQPANDFKTMTRYRLTGDAVFEKVSRSGEIDSGTLGSTSLTNKVDTYARLFGITRQDFINDDLGALSIVPRKLGRGGALKLNSVFWEQWLDDATFFNTDNSKKNYVSGAASNLSIAGLDLAVTAFRRQTDVDGNPLGIIPRLLIVPPELEAQALALTRSVTLNTGGSSTVEKVPNANIYTGRFQVVVSSYLSAAKVWYLAADPRDLAAIEVAFLNGQRTPFVEQSAADFSTLGVQMRGYFDFGVAKQEYRAAVKVKGEA